ncbi:MAG: glycosyltransferase [bacterium]
MPSIKNSLKKISLLYAINKYWKATLCNRRYVSLQAYYKKLAARKKIYYREADIPCLVADIFARRNFHPMPVPKGELRILYVGTVAGQDFGGIIQGLRKFGKVTPFTHKSGKYGQYYGSIGKDKRRENGTRLLEMVQEAQKTDPFHLVIGQMWAYSMSPDALQRVRHLGIPVVNISMDDRHAFYGKRINGCWSGTAGLIGAIDLVCTAAKECCLWYLAEGCPAIYLPEASDPELFRPLSEPKQYDVCFVGANYGIRSKIVKAIEKKGVHVTRYGNGWPNGRIDIEKIPGLFARSRIILGVGTIGYCSDFYALKLRDFDGPMSGSLYLTHDNPDLYELFDVGREIVTYRTPDECVDKVLYYLHHLDEALAIGEAGRKKAVREHTWEKRFEKMLKVIGLR